MWIKYKMYDEPTLYGSGESDLSMKEANLTKPVDCESEVKVRWHMPGEPRLYGNGKNDLITKTWHKFN